LCKINAKNREKMKKKSESRMIAVTGGNGKASVEQKEA
jgi:UDP-N-acetylmuramoylalanine-D-glutamate ligase